MERAIIHEDFDPRILENDICLLLLTDAFDYSDGYKRLHLKQLSLYLLT